MKLKTDFITNSSSASFILYIDSIYDQIEIFNSAWNDYLNEYMEDDHYQIYKEIEEHKNTRESIKKKVVVIEEKIENNIDLNNFEKKLYSDYKDKILELKIKTLGNMEMEHLESRSYKVTHWTSMYNSILMDIPRWMIYLIILYNMKPEFVFEHFGFRNIRLVIEEDC